MPPRDQIIKEESPAYDSRSNGLIESVIKSIQGKIRTMTDALESRLGIKIKDEHPSLPWLVRHAGFIRSRFHIDESGRSPYEKWKGKSFKKELVEFGERVMYYKSGITGNRKMETRWESGIWLGLRDESNEALIGTPDGVIKARDVRRYGSEEERLGSR